MYFFFTLHSIMLDAITISEERERERDDWRDASDNMVIL